MLRLQFDSTLETGDSTVDNQHRHLIDLFNELYDASVDGRGDEQVHATLVALSDYALEHFAAEQRLMVRFQYPPEDVMEHVDEHRRLTERVAALISEHSQSGMATILPLATLLQEWLATHIRVHDRRLVAHIQSQNA